MFPPNSPHMDRIRIKNENDQMNRMAAHHRNQKNWTFIIVKRIFNTRFIFTSFAAKNRQVDHTKTQTGVQRTIKV